MKRPPFRSLRSTLAVCLTATAAWPAGCTVSEPSCTEVECPANSACHIIEDSTSCVCDVGWTGADCDRCDAGYHLEEDACVHDDRCVAAACGAHGSCAIVAGLATCTCEPGYDGPACDRCAEAFHRSGEDCVADEACAPETCGGRGECHLVAGEARCVCAAGHAGADCGECAPGYHSGDAGGCLLDEQCLPGVCGGRGTCGDDGGVVSCRCDAGYDGRLCERCATGFHRDGAGCAADESCAAGACAGHGTCRVDGGVASCTCEPGYAGEDCGACAVGFHAGDEDDCVVDDVCEPEACAGRGLCRVIGGVAECACDTGYGGPDCEDCYPGYHRGAAGACVPDEHCLPALCGRGACADDGGVVQCRCERGDEGRLCERCASGFHRDAAGACVADDVCAAGACSGRGTCRVAGGVATCECNPGYAGAACERCAAGHHRDAAGACVLDEACTPRTCLGHGTCRVNGGVAACACEPGYAGASCEQCAAGFHRDGADLCAADETCLAGTCSGRGTCHVSGGLASCECEAGYGGEACASCAPGFHRDPTSACALNEQCLSNTCSGRGACTDDTGLVACRCDPGYSGVFCDACAAGFRRDGAGACVLGDTCTGVTCSGHGTCRVSGGVASCACQTGYAGADCSACAPGYHASGATCLRDDTCTPSSCSGHGTCRIVGGVAECTCAVGYAGRACEACYPGYVRDDSGACTLSCPPGEILCEGACVDARDPRNCGDCGVTCSGFDQCVETAQGPACGCPPGDPDFATCDGACRRLTTDAAHCGRCANPCDPGESCVGGQCCAGGNCALPDLRVEEGHLRASVQIEAARFAADNCALQEGCVEAPGDRRLMRFTTAVANIGAADLLIGDPAGNPDLEFSPCHGHYHFSAFADFRLKDLAGTVVARGHKQAFCLTDILRVLPDASPPHFNCGYQGITRGWADVYDAALDCQWIDITGVAAGDYVVEVVVNPEGAIVESDYGNNTATAPVHIEDDPNFCTPTTEVCGDGRDQDCDGEIDEGCPPITSNDRCANAWLVNGGGVFSATIGAMTAADVAPGCVVASGGDVFFRIDLPTSEIVYAGTYGSTLDTVLSVRRSQCLGAAQEEACSNDDCGTTQSHFVGTLGAGTWYFAVKARVAGATGTARLTMQRAGCSGAAPITGAGTYAGDTTGAGNDVGTSCGNGSGADQLWYFASCPGDTVFAASTCGIATFDTVLELRRGGCLGVAPADGCNDDATFTPCPTNRVASRLDATLAGPALWFLVVDGYGSNDAGPYSIEIGF